MFPGLGRTMALALNANNASKIFILGRREANLKETASLAINKGSIIPVVCDVTSKDSLQQAYDFIASQTEYIDLLVANSGVIGPRGTTPDKKQPTLAELRESLWQMPMEEFTQVQHVNITGTFYTAVAFLPLLDAANKKKRGPEKTNNATLSSPPRPQIIVTSSIAGFLRVAPTAFAYNFSKAGVNSLIKSLSTTLAGYHIRVNGIAPGIYHSEMSEGLFKARGIPDQGVTDGSVPKEIIPLTRAGTEQDIAGVILWMAGTAGGYLNGNIVVTDGGRLGSMPATY
jgi:NAD(P)-dependent dehydrogenase (short-subunit alcohol dehydrogenase family)